MLIIFVLSLAGIPLTSGFAMKYMLFTNYFKEGFVLEASVILISSVIGLSYYIKFVSDLFTESEKKSTKHKIITPYYETFVHAIILVSVIAVGLFPSLLLGMK
jgi:NADH-quinone oxidoreductase subunit N